MDAALFAELKEKVRLRMRENRRGFPDAFLAVLEDLPEFNPGEKSDLERAVRKALGIKPGKQGGRSGGFLKRITLKELEEINSRCRLPYRDD